MSDPDIWYFHHQCARLRLKGRSRGTPLLGNGGWVMRLRRRSWLLPPCEGRTDPTPLLEIVDITRWFSETALVKSVRKPSADRPHGQVSHCPSMHTSSGWQNPQCHQRTANRTRSSSGTDLVASMASHMTPATVGGPRTKETLRSTAASQRRLEMLSQTHRPFPLPLRGHRAACTVPPEAPAPRRAWRSE